ncbi:HWE histidine kinase domain-containing protein [Mesorhizobium sp. CA16]|uniref:HWE histidine kinase domain-containing protein n=1 Tax=Mesorhizobium sp. CA16 TaxID=588496 RepID=UPI0029622B6B|nr:HWE histidine kinase domain-containing protein [Mesorhizobium sp. CA16]
MADFRFWNEQYSEEQAASILYRPCAKCRADYRRIESRPGYHGNEGARASHSNVDARSQPPGQKTNIASFIDDQGNQQAAHNPTAFERQVRERIMALSRSHDLLASGDRKGVTVFELLLSQAEPFGSEGRISMSGQSGADRRRLRLIIDFKDVRRPNL